MSSDRRTRDTERLAVSDESRVLDSPSDLGLSGVVDVEADKLLSIASLAEQFNDDQIKEDARSAAERIAEGRFYVACVGQFKRGKSTLLNALIGEPILPSGVVPVTAVPTILRFGKSLRARVRLRSGEWTEIAIAEIEQYVSEVRNPENSKGVAGLEVFVPSPLLAEGMCFVDTPGLGSVFAGNTAATHAFLPHIDAVIVVIGADPPIAGTEFAVRTAEEMRLNAANRNEAIQKIVHYSKGNPGAIIAMLHMAASPKYVTQQHVKLSPLYIDFRLTWGATHG